MSKIYCSNCGQHIAEDSNYCRNCGAPQHGSESALYRAQNPVIPKATLPAPEINTSEPVEKTKFIKRSRLCPEVKAVFFINYLIKTSILLPLLLIGAVFNPVLFGALLVAYFLVLFWTANVVYQNFYFSVDENGFQKEHGIIHKHQVSIPYQQIQNVNITRSFVDRLFGLAKISIETAGSSNNEPRNVAGGNTTFAEGHLPGMTIPKAKKIHDLLLQQSVAAKQ